MNYYLDVWRGSFDFSGRARRKEYWYFTLYHTILAFSGELLAVGLINENAMIGSVFAAIVFLYILASTVPSIAVTVRRLHDIGKSGSWLFIGFIPLIGSIWLLVLMCTDGTSGPNRYGLDPKALDAGASLTLGNAP